VDQAEQNPDLRKAEVVVTRLHSLGRRRRVAAHDPRPRTMNQREKEEYLREYAS